MEEEVLERDLSLAIALKHIPYKEIIMATKATAYRLDQKSANALSLGVNVTYNRLSDPDLIYPFNSTRPFTVQRGPQHFHSLRRQGQSKQ